MRNRPGRAARLRRRVGRRGAFLATFGLVYVLLGAGLVDRTLDADEVAVYQVVARVMPLASWGVEAIAAGLTAWAGTALRRWHVDAAGFAALQIVACGWAAGMSGAALTGRRAQLRAAQ